jgi:NAD(P)-dependent dehydrogenase (short-subunit alcohol dehydrogenase family)
MNPFDLSNHRALITGGTQGVGGALARAIAAAGANVVLLGLRDDDLAQQTLADCRGFGVEAELVVTDLMQPPDSYLDDLLKLDPIDLLVNNAGTCMDVPFLDFEYDRFQRTIQLNVTAGYFITQAFARRWVDRKTAGRVLFTGSINGILSEPGHTAYDTSKGAVAAMVRTLAVSLAPHNIRVNGMAPGLVRTPLTAVLDKEPRFDQWMKLHTPNGEVPGPEVCGGAAVFLLSDAATHIQGQMLLVDGGMSVWQQPDPPAGWTL